MGVVYDAEYLIAISNPFSCNIYLSGFCSSISSFALFITLTKGLAVNGVALISAAENFNWFKYYLSLKIPSLPFGSKLKLCM